MTTPQATTTGRNPLTLVLTLAVAGIALVTFVVGLFALGATALSSGTVLVGLLALVEFVKPRAVSAWVLVAFDAAYVISAVGSWIAFTDLPGTASYWVAFVLLLLQLGAAVALALVEIGLIKHTPKPAAASYGEYGQGGPGGGYGQPQHGYGQPAGGGYGQPSQGYAAPSGPPPPGYGQPAGVPGYGQGGGYGQPQQPGPGSQPGQQPGQQGGQPGQHAQPQPPSTPPGGGYGSSGSTYGQPGAQQPGQSGPPPQPGTGSGAPASQPWQSPNS